MHMTGNREQLKHWLSIIIPDVILFPLLYCLGNVFAVQMFGGLSLTLGVVLTSSFLFLQYKINTCHLFRNLGVHCLAKPIWLIMQDSLAGPFFQRVFLPSSCPALFLLSFPAQILGRCRDVLSVLSWNWYQKR